MGAALSTPDENRLDKWCRILSDAPWDIVRLILELAAKQDSATAASIALVSKEINSLVIPILYRTVWTSNLHMFENGIPHLRHTTSLILESCNTPDSLLLPRLCPSLLRLHTASDNAYALQGYTVFPDKLHTLVVHGFTSRQRAYIFLPIYSVLTHLTFMHDVPRYFPDNPAEAFPNLTHFACAYRVYGAVAEDGYTTASLLSQELAYVLGKVLQIPSLKIATVLVQDFSRPDTLTVEDMHALLEELPQKDSNEVVLLARSPLDDDQYKDMRIPEAWDTCSDSSFWAVAEEVIHSRRS